MTTLYPSWLEIPVDDLDRATQFYRAVFGLTDTPLYDDPPAQIIVLLPSDKSVRNPGVSLAKSPLHHPGATGAIINFHIGSHAELQTAISNVLAHGGSTITEVIDTGDGTRYLTVRDCEGNRFALSSYEEI